MKTNNTPTPRTVAAFESDKDHHNKNLVDNCCFFRADNLFTEGQNLEREVDALKEKLKAANEDADKMLHYAGHLNICALWANQDGDTPGITKEQQFPPCTCGFTQHLTAHRARLATAKQLKPTAAKVILPSVPPATEEVDGVSEEVVQQAIDVIRTTGRAYCAILQRRLRIGYTRAARVMDILEERGIVGPHKGAESRDILIAIESATGTKQ